MAIGNNAKNKDLEVPSTDALERFTCTFNEELAKDYASNPENLLLQAEAEAEEEGQGTAGDEYQQLETIVARLDKTCTRSAGRVFDYVGSGGVKKTAKAMGYCETQAREIIFTRPEANFIRIIMPNGTITVPTSVPPDQRNIVLLMTTISSAQHFGKTNRVRVGNERRANCPGWFAKDKHDQTAGTETPDTNCSSSHILR